MRKVSTITNNCLECVFLRKKCILGLKRPWNAQTCDDFRPYCLVCVYPEVYCHTCRSKKFRYMKPLKYDMRPLYGGHESLHYDCVWQSFERVHHKY